MHKPNEKFMKAAIEIAKAGVACGQSPFGSVIVRNNEIIACMHNQVWATSDPTAHAEVTCIRACCQQNATIDLSGCVLYSTCEPCPMCLAACHWAKLDEIIFGARIADADGAGFSEMPISNEDMLRMGQSPLKMTAGFMAKECIDLFQLWKNQSSAKSY